MFLTRYGLNIYIYLFIYIYTYIYCKLILDVRRLVHSVRIEEMVPIQLVKIMEQSHSVKADISSAKQKIQKLFSNPEVYFCIQKSPPIFPILSR